MSVQDGNLYADDDEPLYIEEVYNYENWFSSASNRRWAEHVTLVEKSGGYSDIYVRLAWYMARMLTSTDERCAWIDDCDASDKAFTTLAKKVAMDVGFFL